MNTRAASSVVAIAALCFIAGLLGIPHARAQARYPTKPVTIVVSVSAGGSIDTIARSIAEELGKSLGQPVVVENRPGANGNIAATAVARAAPDGHTLLATGGSTLNLNPYLYKDLPFDPRKSFTPITLTARTNLILVVNPKLGVSTVEQFVALAKSKPGQLNYGSAGNGSLIHIATELFNEAAGIDTKHVPYKGLAPAVTDLVAGQVDFMFDSATTMSHIKAGKLNALAVVGPNPLPALPELKVLAAHGIKGVEVASGWHGLFAPAGTPPDIVARLNTEIVKILATPKLKERINAIGAEPASSTSDELAKRLATDLERLGPIVKKTGATLD
jgi:tripartite-type tricarboxylate transporter receptor subunit TctC